jgi:hypothetical protein
MWSEREITIAKQLQEPSTLAFLRKIFIATITSNDEEISKNIVALDDAEYGRLMKVVYLAKKENKSRLNLIAEISKRKPIVAGEEKKVSTLAPR